MNNDNNARYQSAISRCLKIILHERNSVMEYFLFFGAIIAFSAADISLKSDPPYKPSGWRPSGLLLGEYGAPPVPVQASQENLRFVGQFVEVTTAAVPNNAYLPTIIGQPNAAQVYENINEKYGIKALKKWPN